VDTSTSEPPHNLSPIEGPLKHAPAGAGSKLAGAGLGSGMIVWAHSAGLSPTITLTLQALAPWIAIVVSAAGPPLASYIRHEAALWGLQRTLKRMRRFEGGCSDNGARERAKKNIAKVENTITEVMSDQSKIFSAKK
jgi:hypothetical protein